MASYHASPAAQAVALTDLDRIKQKMIIMKNRKKALGRREIELLLGNIVTWGSIIAAFTLAIFS